MIGIIIAVVIVLAGAGSGAYLFLAGDDSEDAAETTTTVLSSVTSGSTLTTGAETTTSASQVATSETNQNSTTSTGEPSTTASLPDRLLADYLTATDAVVEQLVQDDARIPALATQINNTAPNVPRSVWNELQSMMGQLDGVFASLGEVAVPADFEASHEWLKQAAEAMGNRIYATVQGIEAMWDVGTVDAALVQFDLGRQARDEYRECFEQFQNLVPID